MLLFPKKLVDVQPKFLQLISESVEAQLQSIVVKTRGKAAIRGGIISGGNGNRGGVAGKFWNVEGTAAGIPTGYENAAYAVTKAVNKPASSQTKITRIGSQERRVNGADHDIAVYLIGEGCAIALAVALDALSERGIGVIRLADPGDNTHEDELIRIEGARRGDGEFLFPGDRWHLGLVIDGQVVGHDEKHAVVLFCFCGSGAVLIRRILLGDRLVRSRRLLRIGLLRGVGIGARRGI